MAVHQNSICLAGHRFYSVSQGGVELQTRYIGDALAKGGWRVDYLAPNTDGKTGFEDVTARVKVWWYPHFSYIWQAPTALIQDILERIRPDVIYQRGRGQLAESGVLLRYAERTGIPYVFGLSSDTDLDVLYATKTNFTAYKPLWKRLGLLPYSIYLDTSRNAILRQAGYIIAQHEDQAQSVIDKIRRQPYLLRTIHPEVKGEIQKSPEKIVLWVCNYRPFKQGDLFVELADRCKDLNATFIMVYGRTKPEYIEPVLREAKRVSNLTIYAELPPHEVEALMEKASVFVNTSRNEEGFPNTFVQSWLRETPVVSLSVDPGEVLKREKIGICSGSFERLVDDVTELVQNDKRRVNMGKQAREYAERVHGFSYNCDKIVELFSNVVARTCH